MKSLIFLLFIAFALSVPIRKNLIDRNVCLGGEIKNGKCQCPNRTALIGYECKPCIGGTILASKCICPKGKSLIKNECVISPIHKKKISKLLILLDLKEMYVISQLYIYILKKLLIFQFN